MSVRYITAEIERRAIALDKKLSDVPVEVITVNHPVAGFIKRVEQAFLVMTDDMRPELEVYVSIPAVVAINATWPSTWKKP